MTTNISRSTFRQERPDFKGQWRTAQDFSRRAIDLASRSNAKEVAAKYAAEQALRIVFWSSANGLPASDDPQLEPVLKAQTNRALEPGKRQRDPLTAVHSRWRPLARQTKHGRSVTSLSLAVQKIRCSTSSGLPTINATILLHDGQAKEAIEELEITERLEKAADFFPQYIRGLAFHKLESRGREAIREFDKILNNRGEAPLSSLYPLAQLAKARATKDKADYDKFFELWNEADKDMPALVAAKVGVRSSRLTFHQLDKLLE